MRRRNSQRDTEGRKEGNIYTCTYVFVWKTMGWGVGRREVTDQRSPVGVEVANSECWDELRESNDEEVEI